MNNKMFAKHFVQNVCVKMSVRHFMSDKKFVRHFVSDKMSVRHSDHSGKKKKEKIKDTGD